MNDKCKQIAQMVGLAIALVTLLGIFVRAGAILERLDRIERDYYTGIMQEDGVTRSEYLELRDIHVREGDL